MKLACVLMLMGIGYNAVAAQLATVGDVSIVQSNVVTVSNSWYGSVAKTITTSNTMYWNAKVDTTDTRLSDAREPLTHNQAWNTITNTPTFIEEGDTRLSDAREPLAHQQAWSTVTNKPAIILEGDSRLSDARQPLAHQQAWNTITNAPSFIPVNGQASLLVQGLVNAEGTSYILMSGTNLVRYDTVIVTNLIQDSTRIMVTGFNSVTSHLGVVTPWQTPSNVIYFTAQDQQGISYYSQDGWELQVEKLGTCFINYNDEINRWEGFDNAIPISITATCNPVDNGYPMGVGSVVITTPTINEIVTNAVLVETYANVAELQAHTGNTDIHVGVGEKTYWNAKADISVTNNANAVTLSGYNINEIMAVGATYYFTTNLTSYAAVTGRLATLTVPLISQTATYAGPVTNGQYLASYLIPSNETPAVIQKGVYTFSFRGGHTSVPGKNPLIRGDLYIVNSQTGVSVQEFESGLVIVPYGNEPFSITVNVTNDIPRDGLAVVLKTKIMDSDGYVGDYVSYFGPPYYAGFTIPKVNGLYAPKSELDTHTSLSLSGGAHGGIPSGIVTNGQTSVNFGTLTASTVRASSYLHTNGMAFINFTGANRVDFNGQFLQNVAGLNLAGLDINFSNSSWLFWKGTAAGSQKIAFSPLGGLCVGTALTGTEIGMGNASIQSNLTVGSSIGVGTTPSGSYPIEVNGTVSAINTLCSGYASFAKYQPYGNADLRFCDWSGTAAVTIKTSLSPTNTGFVGIGTNTPAQKLHVNGNVLIETNLTVNGIATVAGDTIIGANAITNTIVALSQTVSSRYAWSNVSDLVGLTLTPSQSMSSVKSVVSNNPAINSYPFIFTDTAIGVAGVQPQGEINIKAHMIRSTAGGATCTVKCEAYWVDGSGTVMAEFDVGSTVDIPSVDANELSWTISSTNVSYQATWRRQIRFKVIAKTASPTLTLYIEDGKQLSVHYPVSSSYFASQAELALKAPLANPIFTGNVGIGTNAPQTKLHVMSSSSGYQTTVQTSASENYNKFIAGAKIGEYGISSSFFYFQSLDSLNGIVFFSNSAGNPALKISRATGNVSICEASGLVGIATNNPQANLHVNGNVIIETNLTVKGFSRIILPTSTNGLSSGMLWNSSGSVAIMP